MRHSTIVSKFIVCPTLTFMVLCQTKLKITLKKVNDFALNYSEMSKSINLPKDITEVLDFVHDCKLMHKHLRSQSQLKELI